MSNEFIIAKNGLSLQIKNLFMILEGIMNSIIFLFVLVFFFYRSRKMIKDENRKKSFLIQSVSLVLAFLIFVLNDFAKGVARALNPWTLLVLLACALVFLYFSYQDSRYLKAKRIQEREKAAKEASRPKTKKKINTDYGKKKKKKSKK